MYTTSVIIPVYNAALTLRRCVEALCFGQERDLEIILIEDCSQDNSWELCKTLSNEYQNVFCYRNEKNSGVSFTRNHGLSRATAPYVLFVDSDDWTSSKYARKLLNSAKENPNCFSICGYTFIDRVAESRKDFYLGEEEINIVNIEDILILSENTLLQQLWNKIFRRDVIEAHRIRFDESQSMGEDFQFVLDYMEAADCQKCVVLNEPLYYYIRWNNSSLMSQFGFSQAESAFNRIMQLSRLVGPSAVARTDALLAQSKRNYIYHIVRNKSHSKQEKLEAIERIMCDGKASAYYQKQKVLQAKEQLSVHLRNMKNLIPRVKGRLQRSQLQKRVTHSVAGAVVKDISFISQNCIGGVIYHDMGMQFLSPTVNTFIPEPDFVKFALNLRHYLEQELTLRWEEEYPVGLLGDVEIHFMHYATCKEVKETWERRKARINWDKIFVLATDRDGFDAAVYEQWKQIPYPKVLFTAHPEFTEDAIFYPEYEVAGQVGDLISDRKFYRDQILTSKIAILTTLSKEE